MINLNYALGEQQYLAKSCLRLVCFFERTEDSPVRDFCKSVANKFWDRYNERLKVFSNGFQLTSRRKKPTQKVIEKLNDQIDQIELPWLAGYWLMGDGSLYSPEHDFPSCHVTTELHGWWIEIAYHCDETNGPDKLLEWAQSFCDYPLVSGFAGYGVSSTKNIVNWMEWRLIKTGHRYLYSNFWYPGHIRCFSMSQEEVDLLNEHWRTDLEKGICDIGWLTILNQEYLHKLGPKERSLLGNYLIHEQSGVSIFKACDQPVIGDVNSRSFKKLQGFTDIANATQKIMVDENFFRRYSLSNEPEKVADVAKYLTRNQGE